MADLNFPKDRTELVPPGTGPLQTGDEYVAAGTTWIYNADAGAWGSGSGSVSPSDLYLSKVSDDTAAGKITFEAGLTVGDASQARISPGGSGRFASNVIVGGNPNSGTEDGLLLNPSGIFNVSREREQDLVFQGYVTGNSTPNMTIDAGGMVSVSGPSTPETRAFVANQTIGTNITDCRVFYSTPSFTGTGTVDLINHFVAQPTRPSADYTITETNGFFAGANLAADTVDNAIGFQSSLFHVAGKNNINFFASNDAPNIFKGPLKLEMPVDYWKANSPQQTYLGIRDDSLNAMGGIGHHGGFAIGIYAGGYRRGNGEWASYGINGKNCATSINLGTDEAKITFGADTIKQTGTTSGFSPRFTIDESGGRAGNFFIQTELDDPAAYQTTYAANGEEKKNYIGEEIDLKAVILELQQAKANLEARVAALESA